MLRTMEILRIDKGIRSLIRQLWKHCYRTFSSCEGHGEPGYVIVKGGDGWFEENAEKYGLERYLQNECCKKTEDWMKCCEYCGAGVNGYEIYRGYFKDPFETNNHVF